MATIHAAARDQGELNHAVGRNLDNEDSTGRNFTDPSWIYATTR